VSAVALIVIGLGVGLAIGELVLRRGTWRPPVQIIRGFGLHSLGGIPVWEQSDDRQNRACVEEHPSGPACSSSAARSPTVRT
jgi:hypothetical protein